MIEWVFMLYFAFPGPLHDGVKVGNFKTKAACEAVRKTIESGMLKILSDGEKSHDIIAPKECITWRTTIP